MNKNKIYNATLKVKGELFDKVTGENLYGIDEIVSVQIQKNENNVFELINKDETVEQMIYFGDLAIFDICYYYRELIKKLDDIKFNDIYRCYLNF